MVSDQKLRWGILGAADIARKNWKAIWNSGNGRVVAVAGRDLDRTNRFIAECQRDVPFDAVPRAFASYEELVAAADVDAIYAPLPTGIRGHWVKRAAEGGKHVICEKPCAASVTELKEMLEICRRNKVQFMDGVMFMHSLRLERLRQVLDDEQSIGKPRRITSAFSFLADDEFFVSNIRARSELEPYGCLGDLGWYCIRFALWVMQWQMPSQAIGRVLSERKHPESAKAIPAEFSAELLFPGGVTSSFFCSFMTETEQWAVISGTRGHLKVDDFVLPYSRTKTSFQTGNPVYEKHGCDFEMLPHLRLQEIEEPSHGKPEAQESRMFRDFAEQVRSGTLNEFWPETALKTQRVMEECLKSAKTASSSGRIV